MIPQSGFDIKVIINELNELSKGRIEKFYNTPDGELLIKVYKAKFGKVLIRVLRGECIHLTNFKRETTDHPSNFTMLMRKYMNGATIESVTQPFFERVIIFKVKKGENYYNIILELFNKGNIVVCNEKMTIINSLRFIKVKDRIIRPNEVYEFPKPNFEEAYLDKIEFKRIIKSSKRESIVKCLATEIGLGGKYAEEVCSLAELDKTKNPSMLSIDELENLFKVFFLVYKSIKHYTNIKPCVIIKDDEILNFAPFPLKSYEDYEFKFFESFNEACDYYYSNSQKEQIETNAETKFNSNVKQLETRLEKQEENLDFLKSESIRLGKLGEIVFSNYDLINTILGKIRDANKNKVEWDVIKKMVENEKSQGSVEAQAIKEINESNGKITLFLQGHEFSVDLTSNATDIAQGFFEKSKKYKNKIDGTEKSIDNTKEKIELVIDKGLEFEKEIIEKKKIDKKWYEKFRWLKTTNNMLLVCGKDATQNEILVKKIVEDNDLIFHASIAGSPFGILKNGKTAEAKDKKDCAEFIAAYSRAWRENMPTDVFSVSKEQVSKTAPTGEYVAHGSFIIKGEKEFYRGLWPEITLGYNQDNEIIAGPNDIIKPRCKQSVILRPGGISPGKIAKRLMNLFEDAKFRSEELLHFIPGESMIEY